MIIIVVSILFQLSFYGTLSQLYEVYHMLYEFVILRFGIAFEFYVL